MLKRGSILLSIWCVINFILAFIILSYVIVFQRNSPILQVASFSGTEIASLGAKTIAALNCLTILYNSCSMVISVLVWLVIRKNLIAGQKWAFWALLSVIGFYRSDGNYRFLLHWARALAGQRCSERTIRGGHWIVCLSHTQAKKPAA